MTRKSAGSLLWYFVIVFLVIVVLGYYKTRKPQTETVKADVSQDQSSQSRSSSSVSETTSVNEPTNHPIPILIGKSRQEILRLYGTPDDSNHLSWLEWVFWNKPLQGYNLTIRFIENPQDKVDVAVVLQGSADYRNFVQANELIPDILTSEPQRISVDTFRNELRLFWRLEGVACYVDVGRDAQEKLFTETKTVDANGDVQSSYQLSSSGAEWRNTSLLRIWQVRSDKLGKVDYDLIDFDNRFRRRIK